MYEAKPGQTLVAPSIFTLSQMVDRTCHITSKSETTLVWILKNFCTKKKIKDNITHAFYIYSKPYALIP